MLITLIGMPASGKTTVGTLLAEALGCPFWDLDALVERKAGKSIPAIFAEDGEAAFRQIEARLLKETVAKYASSPADTPSAVLALGGGSVALPGAVKLLREQSLCVYLRTSLDTLAGRLAAETTPRPLFASHSPEDLLAARAPLYEAAAPIVLDTDGATPEALVDELIISVL